MEKEILLHAENIEKFLGELCEMNQILVKKNQPKVDFYVASIEDHNVLKLNLYSEKSERVFSLYFRTTNTIAIVL